MTKDDSTWLNLFYIACSAITGFLLYKLFVTLSIQFAWEEKYVSWLPTARLVLSVVLGGVFFLWLRSSSERQEYFLGAIAELRKVSWPTFDDTRKMTIVVVIFVLIFAVILFAFDYVWRTSLGLIL